jgi:hypothetical protein
MKNVIAVIVIALALIGSAFAKKNKYSNIVIPPGACLAVTPGGAACYSWLTKTIDASYCYSYVESTNLPIRATNSWYEKKDLETLEDRGAKIVLVNKATYHVRGKDSVQVPTDDSKTAGAVDLTQSLETGCSK